MCLRMPHVTNRGLRRVHQHQCNVWMKEALDVQSFLGSHPEGGVWIQRECHPNAAEQAWCIRAEDKPIADKHSVDDPSRTVQYSGRKGQWVQILHQYQTLKPHVPCPTCTGVIWSNACCMLYSKASYGADSILTPRCCPLRTASTSPVAMKCLVIPKVVPKMGTTQDVTMLILKPDGLRIHFIPCNWISRKA